ncbi:hypothetical protein KAZ01_01330 [Candidatus Gracilibacteria bacterium]|nr:hypothetical protein [Candidatus Gracilibacteria bacterium]
MVNKNGNSIIEIMVVLVVLTVGVVGTYGILNSGQKLASTTENRVKAINIAREGIEAVQNIRDTNWIKFSSDHTNCWKVLNYDPLCIGNSSSNIISTGSYILLNSGSLWILYGVIVNPSWNFYTYKQNFPVYYDSNGLISQSGSYSVLCSSTLNKDCLSIFSREIKIENPDNSRLKVSSIVKWVDNSSSAEPHVINLETILTNWKEDL